MVGVDLIGDVRRVYFEQKRPIKEIMRAFSASRTTVREVIRRQKTAFKYERGFYPAPKLGEWVKVLVDIPEVEAKRPRRERRLTQRPFEELRDRGDDGAQRSVRIFWTGAERRSNTRGAIKQWMNKGAFLTRGLERVRAEFSLTALAYNLQKLRSPTLWPCRRADRRMLWVWRGLIGRTSKSHNAKPAVFTPSNVRLMKQPPGMTHRSTLIATAARVFTRCLTTSATHAELHASTGTRVLKPCVRSLPAILGKVIDDGVEMG